MGLWRGPPKQLLLPPEEFYLGYFSVGEHEEVGTQLSDLGVKTVGTQ